MDLSMRLFVGLVSGIITVIYCSLLVYSRKADHTSTQNIRNFYLSKSDSEMYEKNILKKKISMYKDFIEKATVNYEALKKELGDDK